MSNSAAPPPPYVPDAVSPPFSNTSLPEALSSLLFQIQEYGLQVVSLVKDSIPNSNPDSVITNWIVTALCVILTLLLVVLFVAVGWYIVWSCFLSHFKFVRELLLGNSSSNTPSAPCSPEKPKPPSRKRRSKPQLYD